MSITEASIPKAFAVRFSEVKRWDPNNFHSITWHWPSSVMAPIGSVLTPLKIKVDRGDNGFSELMPVTIHFDGSIEPRKMNRGKEYTMDLFWAKPGSIVASKIDLKNGAVAIVPDKWDNVVVTNHFAVYEPDLGRIVPQYFHLLIQANFFKEHLWRNKVGAEGRKEVKLDFFESLEIPIPDISIQQKIVSYWEHLQEKNKTGTDQVSLSIQKIKNQLLASAGIEITIQNRLPRAMTKSFRKIERWGIEFNRYSWDLTNLISSKSHKCSPLSEYAWINPGTNIGIDEESPVSFIPMAAVDEKDGIVLSPEIRKITQVKKGYTRFIENDVLWAKITPCMQNGKSAIAKNLMNGLGFGSTEFHIIRSKNQSLLKNEFIHLILRLPQIRQAAMRFFVGSAGQQRVPKEFLEGLHIPIPPIDLQINIIKETEKILKNISKLRFQKKDQYYTHNQRLTELILGTLSVEEI